MNFENVVAQSVRANIEQPKAVEMTVKCVDAGNVALSRGEAIPALLLYGLGVLYATQWVPTDVHNAGRLRR